jgi:hypothetical protein
MESYNFHTTATKVTKNIYDSTVFMIHDDGGYFDLLLCGNCRLVVFDETTYWNTNSSQMCMNVRWLSQQWKGKDSLTIVGIQRTAPGQQILIQAA